MSDDLRVQLDIINDVMGKWSRRITALDELRRVRHKIAKLGTVCGDCNNWMKSRQCPREINVNGYSCGPSCETLVGSCDSYQEKPGEFGVAARRANLTHEAQRLEAVIEEDE